VGPRLPLIITHSLSSTLLTRQIRTAARSNRDTTFSWHHRGLPKEQKSEDILVRAKLSPLTQPRSTRLTDFYLFRPWARNPNNGDVFATQKHSGPATRNCVYLISCRTSTWARPGTLS
jgi:hypothetical protein